MKTIVLAAACMLCTAFCSAQGLYNTNGKFELTGILAIPDTYLVSPGQVSKSGDHYLLGLTSGDLENLYDLSSNIYRYNLNDKEPGANQFKSLNLPSEIDEYRFYQCSASADEKVLVFVANSGGGWADNDLAISIRDSAGNYPNMYYLTELNDEVSSDAYPWLSYDALRLYYSRDFTLMYTERKTESGEFSAPVPVDFVGDVNLEIISCWLSEDELKMYFIANNLIYRSVRKQKTDPFSFPEVFTSEFKDFYFIAGLSFTPDRKTMYLYYSDENTEKILEYRLKKGKI